MIAASLALLALLAPPAPAPPAAPAAPAAGPSVALDTTQGRIVIALDRQRAPKSVDNFLRYVKEKHYDGTVFHRVIPGFMIQGGGMDAQLQERDQHEPIANESANGLKNLRGTIAMARTSDPDSATAQFFINLKDNAALDPSGEPGYAVFGKVTEGMEVVDRIAGTPTTTRYPFQNVPVTAVVIRSARVVGAAAVTPAAVPRPPAPPARPPTAAKRPAPRKPGAVTPAKPRPAPRPSPKP